MSTSRLTASPLAFLPSVVTARVCGMIATSKPSAVSEATVRLIPSTATEPFPSASMIPVNIVLYVSCYQEVRPQPAEPHLAQGERIRHPRAPGPSHRPRRRSAADDLRRDEDLHPVDEPRLQKARRHLRPAL